MMTHDSRILFVCKIRSHFYGPSFGLINSCRFIANALESYGIDCKVVSVVDNNDIDREIHKFKPTHVFVEALWVAPSKFKQLIPLHPKLKWYVRVHSNISFLANEGMAIEWLREYYEISKSYKSLRLASNSEEFIECFDVAYNIPVEYFPNIYCPKVEDCDACSVEDDKGKGKGKDKKHDDDDKKENSNRIDIGCFGAIRPMKNHLNQALASIAFGNELRAKIHFHINHDRCESGGDPVLKNLVHAFENTNHKLVFHPWVDHHDFIRLVKRMEVGLQVSMSETFNIVAADFVWNDIPFVGSDEIIWLDRRYKADANSVESIIDKIRFAYKGRKHNAQKVNKENLEKFNKKSTKIWIDAL